MLDSVATSVMMVSASIMSAMCGIVAYLYAKHALASNYPSTPALMCAGVCFAIFTFCGSVLLDM